MLHIFYLL